MTATVAAPHTSSRLGVARACVVAGVLGAALAAVDLLWHASVSKDRYSYPKSPGAFRINQVVLAIHHVPLVLGLLALAAMAPGARARRGIQVGAVGMALLAVVELVNIAGASTDTESSTAATLGTLYGVATLVIGLGLVVGGVAAIRAAWSVPGWIRWLPLVLGVYMFVPLTPALIISPEAGFVALAGWSLLYAVLGRALSDPALADRPR